MKKKMSMLFTLSLLLVAVVGCSDSEAVPPSTNNGDPSSVDSQFVEYGVAGRIVEKTTTEDETVLGSIKVEGSKDNGATYSEAVVTITADTIIYLSDRTDFDYLEVGMYVNVFFEGAAAESFPVQATAKQINIIPDDGNIDVENADEMSEDISDNS